LDQPAIDVVSVILGAAIGGALTMLAAYLFGDVRATKLYIKYEKIKATERRKRILIALHAQVLSLPRINTYNQMATQRPLPPIYALLSPYPTVPFETAIFSENGISVSDKTIEATTEYLLKARELNALVEPLRNARLISTGGDSEEERIELIRRFIYDQANDQAKDGMPQRIESLKACIESEQRSQGQTNINNSPLT